MEDNEIKKIIMRELPGIIERDREVQELIIKLSRRYFAEKAETEGRFDRLLEELRADRERQDRKWAEQERKWEGQERKWEEQQRRWEENQKTLREMREEQNAKWEQQNAKWEEQNAKWEQQNRRWQEQERRWEENQKTLREMMESIKALSRKHDSTIGALGARWGLYTEESFRSALKGILQDSFDVKVLRVNEYDSRGEVFGRPEQVELDLIIKDGVLIICEIKSSMSRADMYMFERKARFYEKKHQRQASRLMVISPMVDERAREVAGRLGIEVYSYAEDVDPALFV